jgi:hypothetical protein
MGRCPLLPGQHASRLTPPQREMLRLTVQAGFCVNRTPATYHDAWSVRTGNTRSQVGAGVRVTFYPKRATHFGKSKSASTNYPTESW